ncbi:DOCK family protein [Cavenderia fasciculata]|uniref:DOCK family protein n=1 Tax=Cavenderia fasciculata TaxID=261658 RepID=F4PSQ5_CACFS|nr:DOCK family protein [Cavenderia fasciculata]EGG21533.1 DOCK family protein [Cavenderia fasciculata]|eukprot:XP_004359383.1 DOCK family protein [Cavenderia fasciculata]
MEGKKLSSFIKSKKTNTSSNSLPLSSSSSSSTTTTAPLNESINGTSASKESSTTSNNNNNHSQSNELTPEEYAKRNTRQIPAILLEDDVETEHEQYPFDFEKYYYESKEINRETVRELVVIPDETTTDHVQLIPKYNRTLVLPSDYKKGANQYIDDCIDFYYSTNWKTLKGNDFTVDETPHSIVNSIMEKKIEYKALPDDSSSSSSSSNDSPSNSSNGVPPPQPTITTTISASSNGNNNSKFHHHHQSGSNGGGGAVDVSIFQSNSVVVKSDDVDELHMNYLERQLRVQNKQEQHQKSLYSYFTLSEQPPSIVDPPIYQKEKARVILVDCKDLVFKFWEKDEETEPFYCSLYLFDISKKVRVSDVFHFDFINEKTDKLLGANQKTKDDLNATKKAIFTVAKSSQDIYLVLKVEKILMGDLEDQAEPYIKCNLKDKEREKLKEQIRSNCSRLGAYRQAFCWGCVPVFGDEGELGVGENTHFRPLYRYRPDSTDAQMLDSTLGEFSKSASTKKLKVIPGHCTVDMSEVSNYHNLFTSPFEPNTIVYNQSLTPINICQPQPLPVQSSASSSLSTTPSLLSPRPEDAIPSAKTTATTTTVPTTTTPDKLIKEMQEFSSFPRFEANQEYIHNLYIYPESVNFSNRSGSVTARNITCKIQLMENDDNVNFDGMKLIYGRSNNDSFTSKYLTSVTYHSKTPFFYDEIKLKLPINLNSNQHLLFTFYHITCQKSDKENSFDAPIGHAVLPIYANGNGKILSDDVYTLPVAYELPPRYNKDTQEVVRYVDNKKPIFQVRTKLVSSIASTDDSITTFFNVISSPGASSDQMAKAIKNLKNCKLESIAQYFPIVMNQLFRIMTSSKHSHELAMTTFIVIGDILNIVNDINGKVHERYAKFVFTNIVQQDSTLPPSSSPSSTHPHEHQPVYEVLIKTWLELMRFQEHNSENILRFSKFFFTIIFKSMSLSLIERSKREENKTRKGRFVGVRCQLRKLISILRWEASTRVKHTFKLSKELVKSLGHLISSLLSICDRGYVFSIIDKVVLDFDQSTNESETEINELKFEFLRIICQNDFFVQLNLPMPYRIDPSLKLNNVLSSSKHFLSELLNSHISNGLSHKECLVRMDAANSLRDTLIKIEMDTRWQDPLTKQRIVGVSITTRTTLKWSPISTIVSPTTTSPMPTHVSSGCKDWPTSTKNKRTLPKLPSATCIWPRWYQSTWCWSARPSPRSTGRQRSSTSTRTRWRRATRTLSAKTTTITSDSPSTISARSSTTPYSCSRMPISTRLPIWCTSCYYPSTSTISTMRSWPNVTVTSKTSF